jgi:hypothetical protein
LICIFWENPKLEIRKSEKIKNFVFIKNLV